MRHAAAAAVADVGDDGLVDDGDAEQERGALRVGERVGELAAHDLDVLGRRAGDVDQEFRVRFLRIVLR